MGMMNNGYYIVKPIQSADGKKLVFQHPVDIKDDSDVGGWMKPSTENQLEAAKQDSGVPEKHFTREEVEKHDKAEDCWIVINEKVYDATSVLDWHPGGQASILSYAGRLTSETTESFESIHDEYAHKKLHGIPSFPLSFEDVIGEEQLTRIQIV
jgi:nitrate reductase (NAD(P)H)